MGQVLSVFGMFSSGTAKDNAVSISAPLTPISEHYSRDGLRAQLIDFRDVSTKPSLGFLCVNEIVFKEALELAKSLSLDVDSQKSALRITITRNSEHQMLALARAQKSIQDQYVPVLTPPVFTLDQVDAALQYYEEQGFVVFKDCISEQLQSEYCDAVWAWLKEVESSKIDRDDPSTWNLENWSYTSNAIYSYSGICHLEPVWKVRECAHPYFAAVWGSEKLMCSMDGMSIMRPTALPEGSEDYSTRKNWLHVDSDGFAPPAPLTFGTQGVVNVSGMDGTNGLGGAFQCVPGSHLDFAEWMEAHTSIRHKGAQYTSVPKEDTMLNLRKRMVRLNVPDRSITIWKNELFHCNHPNESRRVRFAQYVNMEPAAWVADDVVIQRIQAYTEGRGTTHWVRTLNPSSGHCVDYTPPVLGDVAKKLLGMDSW